MTSEADGPSASDRCNVLCELLSEAGDDVGETGSDADRLLLSNCEEVLRFGVSDSNETDREAEVLLGSIISDGRVSSLSCKIRRQLG